ncbi:hypothetical protein V5O48_017798 [Marasmius crinis-equi]|uniref:PUB domain-containing protein n=1 Tax=Marasmius crinis-equi TaxID=585013 RepID=A0ABR3EN38_9AGAR
MEQSATPLNLAEAAERRQQESSQRRSLADERAEHEKRQHFRRLVDPGIMRPNAAPQALESLRTIQKLCQNIVTDPDNEKYHRIKTTNPKITKDIVSPKGTVELLRELGFHPQVEDFQPYYHFNPARMKDLQIGYKIIGEALEVHNEKEERIASARKLEKEARAQAAEKVTPLVTVDTCAHTVYFPRYMIQVKLAFMDDRRAKSELDEREKVLREARAASGARQEEQPRQRRQQPDADEAEDETENPISIASSMPGAGHTLRGSPPPYTNQDVDD